MSDEQSRTIEVPGATLFYRLRGAGPLLLLLPGGDGDASACDAMASHLVHRFRVLTYDRRGYSRSTVRDESLPLSFETHGDDVHHLLAALTSEPSLVFGNSFGALLGLDLAARYPTQVRTLVAHEAPTLELLRADEQAIARAQQEEAETTHRTAGVAAAMQRFAAMSGFDINDREPDAPMVRPGPARLANLEVFLSRDAPAVRLYRLHREGVRAVAERIIPAAGTTNRSLWIHHCAQALAELVGRPMVEFPGGHNGFATHPRAFATRLIETLGLTEGS